jgi:hypothetical protein
MVSSDNESICDAGSDRCSGSTDAFRRIVIGSCFRFTSAALPTEADANNITKLKKRRLIMIGCFLMTHNPLPLYNYQQFGVFIQSPVLRPPSHQAKERTYLLQRFLHSISNWTEV